MALRCRVIFLALEVVEPVKFYKRSFLWKWAYTFTRL